MARVLLLMTFLRGARVGFSADDDTKRSRPCSRHAQTFEAVISLFPATCFREAGCEGPCSPFCGALSTVAPTDAMREERREGTPGCHGDVQSRHRMRRGANDYVTGTVEKRRKWCQRKQRRDGEQGHPLVCSFLLPALRVLLVSITPAISIRESPLGSASAASDAVAGISRCGPPTRPPPRPTTRPPIRLGRSQRG